MKRILILIIGLFSVAHAQFAPTSAKTAFKNGVSVGTRDSTAYAANDSLVVVINRQGRLMYRSTDGYWKLLANAASSDYVPYTGAVDNVALGNFRLTARSLRTDSIYANGSGGLHLLSNSGSQVVLFGAGGGTGTTLYGGLNGTSFTFSLDGTVNGRTLGKGTNSGSANTVFGESALAGTGTGASNTAIGNAVLVNNTNGSFNTGIGSAALLSNTIGINNTAIGVSSLAFNTSDSNTAVGSASLASNTTGKDNVAIGYRAGGPNGLGGAGNQTGNGNTYIGSWARNSGVGNSNETVIGSFTNGNGSNTVTIGNSSVTDNYFSGNIRGGAFIKSGGTSSQFLKADGSVDGTSYATAASISGTTNYIPKFTSAGAIGNSLLFDNGKDIGIGTASPTSIGANYRTVEAVGGDGTYLFVKRTNATAITGELAADDAVYLSAKTNHNLNFRQNDITRGRINTSGTWEFLTAINGTSLFMSGGGSFGSLTVSSGTASFNSNLNMLNGSVVIRNNANTATYGSFARSGLIEGNSNTEVGIFAETGFGINSYVNGSATVATRLDDDGTFLINTTTTDGTNKLIVNGGVKASSLDITGTVARFNSSGNWMEFNTNVLTSNDNSGAHIRSVITDATVPTYSWKGDQNTGMWNPAADELGFATGGVNRLTLSSTGAATFSSSVYGQGYRFAYASKSSNYTLTDNDDYINVTASCTITLPTAVGRSGKRYVIKCTGSAVATIASTSSQTIDGNTASTYTFGGPNFNIMIVYSDGSNWFLEAWQTGI